MPGGRTAAPWTPSPGQTARSAGWRGDNSQRKLGLILFRCLQIGMMPDRVDMVQRKRGRKTEAKAKTVDKTQKEANLDSPQTSEQGDLDFPKSSNDFSPLNTEDLDSSPHDEMSVEMEILVEEHTVSVDMESLVEENIQTVLVDIVSLVKEHTVLVDIDNLVEEQAHTVSVDMDSLVEECFLEFTQAPEIPEPRQERLFFGLDPVLELTFEEEFKIHELVVRKEFLQDSIFTLLLEVPFLKNFFFNFYLTGRTLDELDFRKAFRETFQATLRGTLTQVF